jgi:hypothetical protein
VQDQAEDLVRNEKGTGGVGLEDEELRVRVDRIFVSLKKLLVNI